MNDVIGIFDDLLRPIYQPLLPYLMPALMVTVVTLVAVRFGLSWLIREWNRLINRTPRALHKVKRELLAHTDIAEMYAPAQQYTRDLREKERPRQFAWLSPFPRAVRASIKRNNVPSGQKLDARAQIRAAAKCVKVRKPEPQDNVAGEMDKHFRIDMKLDGHDVNELHKLQGRIKAQLGLHSITPLDTSDNFTMSFIAHREAPVDILTERKAGVEFFDENPAKTPYRIPLAIKEDGTCWSLNTHQTLIYGTSGSGKGSPIQGTIKQLAPHVARGVVQLHGIDPKKAELKGYEFLNSSLFKKITSGLKDDDVRAHGEHLAEIIDILDYRMNNLKVSVDENDVNLQRDVPATKETPLVVLFIDEYLTLYRGFKKLGREGATHLANMEQIIATGRSYGVFIVAATQRASTEVLSEIRDNISNAIVLRQKSDHFNDLFLGEGAKERGYDSTSIPASSKANGYATAGIGYVQEESGDLVKIRFAYLGDDDVAQLIRDYEREHGRGDIAETQIDEFEDVMETASLDDDFLFEDDENTEDDGDFKIEELPTLSDD